MFMVCFAARTVKLDPKKLAPGLYMTLMVASGIEPETSDRGERGRREEEWRGRKRTNLAVVMAALDRCMGWKLHR